MNLAVRYFSQCAWIFQVLGQQFFSVQSLTFDNLNTPPTRGYLVNFVCYFVVLNTQLGIYIYLYLFKNPIKLTPKNFINVLVQYFYWTGLVLLLSVGLIESFRTTPVMKKFFWNFIKISSICRRDFGHTIDHKIIQIQTFRDSLVLFLIYGVSEAILRSYDEDAVVLKLCIISVPKFYFVVIFYKFIFYVKMVNFHLNEVSTLLSKAFAKPSFQTSELIFFTKNNPRVISDIEKRLRSLRTIYNMISSNADIVNHSMGFSILIITLIMVTFITSTGYYLLVSILSKAPDENLSSKNFFISRYFLKENFQQN